MAILPPSVAAAQARVAASNTGVLAAPAFNQEDMLSKLLQLPTFLDTKDSGVDHVELYGAPGTGKTVALALLSEFFHVMVFNGDKGMSAARNNLPPELQRRIISVDIPDNKDFPLYFNTMFQVLTGRKLNLCVTHGVKDCPACKNGAGQVFDIALNLLPRNWVVGMDSQTQYVESAVNHVIRKANKLLPSVETPIDYRMERDDWGMLKNIMGATGSFIKDLKCNFVGIAHEAMVEGEDKLAKLVAVGGSDNSSKNFAKNYDSVVFTRVSNGKHNYASSSTYSGQIQTKTRSNVALEKCTIPSLLHLFRPKEAEELLKGSYNEWFYSGQDPKKSYKIKEILEL